MSRFFSDLGPSINGLHLILCKTFEFMLNCIYRYLTNCVAVVRLSSFFGLFERIFVVYLHMPTRSSLSCFACLYDYFNHYTVVVYQYALKLGFNYDYSEFEIFKKSNSSLVSVFWETERVSL